MKNQKIVEFFRFLEKRDFDDISKTASTYQLHTSAVTPEDFERFNATKNFFDVTSYATDSKGKKSSTQLKRRIFRFMEFNIILK